MFRQVDPWIPVLRSLDVLGTYQALVSIVPLQCSEVEKLLPVELELARQSYSASGTHPLIFISGQQQKVRHDFFGRSSPLAFTYTEFVLAVPSVQFKVAYRKAGTYSGPFYFMPRLFLDNPVPIALGYYYGFDKRLKSFNSSSTGFEVGDHRTGEPILRTRFSDLQTSYQLASEVPAFAPISQMMAQPVLGRRIDGYVGSRFRWEGQQALQIQPLAQRLEVLRPLVPDFGVFNFESKALGAQALGSFRMISNWRLSGPMSFRTLSPSRIHHSP